MVGFEEAGTVVRMVLGGWGGGVSGDCFQCLLSTLMYSYSGLGF